MIIIEILQLKYFCELAQTQHVTRTAEHLHIAQPALTQTIHRLEKELGVKLFRSSGRNIVLTEEGRYLQQKVVPIMKAIGEIPDEIREVSFARKKILKINVLAASTVVTKAIIEYQKMHSGVNFRIVQNSEAEGADITIFTRESFQKPASSKDSYYVFTERIFLAVPKPSAYSELESVDLREMAGREFIALAGSRSLRMICDRFCLHAGFRPEVIFESDSPEAVKNLIGASMGVGFWPHYTWGEPDTNHMALIPIAEPVCQREIIIQFHEQRTESEEAQAFFEFLKDYFDRIRA